MSNCSSLQTIFQASLTQNESLIFSSVFLSNVHRILKFLVDLAWENVVNMTSPMSRFYWSIKRVTIVANMDWSYVHSLRSESSLYVLLNPEVRQWMQQEENILFLTVSAEFKCLLHLPDLICFLGHYVGDVVSISPFWDKSVMQQHWTGITGELRKWNFHIYIYIGFLIENFYTVSFGIPWKKGHKVSVACTTLTTIKRNLFTFALKRNFYSNNRIMIICRIWI